MNIEIRDITKKYKTKYVFQGFSLTISDNQIVGLYGRSGTGKSTLLSLMAGLDIPEAGSIHVDGEPLPHSFAKLAEYRRRKLGIVPQSFMLLHYKTVFYNIALPFLYSKEKENLKQKITQLAEELEIAHLLEKKPTELSEGERQRVAISRAVITNPEMILADEPTSALDEMTQALVKNLFLNQKKRGATIIFSSHNKLFGDFADEIVELPLNGHA